MEIGWYVIRENVDRSSSTLESFRLCQSWPRLLQLKRDLKLRWQLV